MNKPVMYLYLYIVTMVATIVAVVTTRDNPTDQWYAGILTFVTFVCAPIIVFVAWFMLLRTTTAPLIRHDSVLGI